MIIIIIALIYLIYEINRLKIYYYDLSEYERKLKIEWIQEYVKLRDKKDEGDWWK